MKGEEVSQPYKRDLGFFFRPVVLKIYCIQAREIPKFLLNTV